MRRNLVALGAFGALMLGGVIARANGDYDEGEYPVNPAAPVAPVPGRLLPFPVKDETSPVAPPLVGPKATPESVVYLPVSSLLTGLKHDTVLGSSLRNFQGVIVRQSQVERGKVTLPVSSLAFLMEVAPGASPLVGDVFYVAGAPNSLVDVDQTIVVRKDVTLPLGEGVVLGSTVIRYVSANTMAGTVSAGITTESLSGLDWSRYGSGNFEVSTTQPAWRAPLFRNGLVQGSVTEVTAKQVKFGWISSTRTNGIVLADKEERGGKLKANDEVALPGGRKIKVVAVSPAKSVSLETPDGAKTLVAPPDLKVLPEDSDARKKLILLGKDWAVVLNPNLSDFPKGEAQLYVYSGTRSHRNGEPFEGDASWRVWPTALGNGLVVGVLLTNDKPLQLDPKSPKVEGPGGNFKLVTSWNGEELGSFHVEYKGERSPDVTGSGRKSIDFVAGGGPTVASVLSRTRVESGGVPKDTAAAATPAPAGSATPEAGPTPTWRTDPVGWARPHLLWLAGGAGFGLFLAIVIGLMRRRKNPWD
jgi:hypothetical protein